MRKLVVTEFMSLDGVFQAPGSDGSGHKYEGYKYEGWTSPFNNEEFMKFKSEELDETDILLLGRITYEAFAKVWPKIKGDPFSDKFNSMPKYVVSNTLTKTSWNNSHIISGDVVSEIKKLKDSEGGDITVHGSGTIVRFLLDNELVDQINILLYPIVLGTGKKLFEGAEKADLELIDSKPFKTGVVLLQYQPKK